MNRLESAQRPMLDRSNAFHIGFNEQIEYVFGVLRIISMCMFIGFRSFQRIRRQRRQERERRIHSFESLLKESKLLPDPLRLYDALGVPPEVWSWRLPISYSCAIDCVSYS